MCRVSQSGYQADSPPPPTDQAPPDSSSKVKWTSERKGVDKYITYASKPGEPEDRRVGLVLERSGFANWKLTEVQLPALK